MLPDFNPSTVAPEQILVVLARLAAWQSQLLARLMATPPQQTASNRASPPGPLLTASQMAEHLNVRESAVRTMERGGKIPSVRVGRYVRFRATEVEVALRAF